MKVHKGLLPLFIGIFLVGCASKVDENQWSSLQGDMSIEKVEKALGKPNNTIVNKREMLDEVNQKINSSKDLINNPTFADSDAIKPLEQVVEDLETIRHGIENDGDSKILQYEIKGEREDGESFTATRNVYLYGDRVVYYDGARQ